MGINENVFHQQPFTGHHEVKQLTWKLVLPLTVLSFVMFTKRWYVDVVDGPHEMLYGFPLAFICKAWHTSLAYQIFVVPFVVDLLTYFLFWFLIIYLMNRFVTPIKMRWYVAAPILALTGFVTAFSVLFALNPDHIYTMTSELDLKIISTHYEFVWQEDV